MMEGLVCLLRHLGPSAGAALDEGSYSVTWSGDIWELL